MKKGFAGKRRESVRSDCYVEIQPQRRGGIRLDLHSKVESMYGVSIRALIQEMCAFFEISSAKIVIEDYGALPYVIAARFEAALKAAVSGIRKEFLLPLHPKNRDATNKERLRRSRLYLPGNEPKFFINASLHRPDAIILDLEDSVAPAEKEAARYLVRNALRSVDFGAAEKWCASTNWSEVLKI